MDSRLFIGGPYDGEWRVVEPHRHGDVIPVYSPLASIPSIPPTHAAVRYKPYSVYRCMDWCVDGFRTQVYVAVELQSERVLEKLLEGYAGTGET